MESIDISFDWGGAEFGWDRPLMESIDMFFGWYALIVCGAVGVRSQYSHQELEFEGGSIH